MQAIFFDRDGTLGNLSDVRYPDTFEPFEGVREMFDALHRLGLKVFIATNQSCVARGTDRGYDFAAEFRALGADDWFVCPHDSPDKCGCRKPLTGLLEQARDRYGLDLTACAMVGDRWTDMKCGRDAGTRCILLRNPASPPPENSPECLAYLRGADAQADDIRQIPAIVAAWIRTT